ncbi:MAG: METTL5 family protein [Halobacteriaceae archaeon]
MDRGALERRLDSAAGFADPQVSLEQYPTPADVAAHLLHFAAMQGDLAGRTVVDLGAGTGVLALGAACLGPARVIALERDADALATARENEPRIAPDAPVTWVRGDAVRPPFDTDDATVVMNPPFGAQTGREGADRAFLASAGDIAAVSHSIHNAGSRDFVESFAADNGGTVTHAFRVRLALDRQFAFHEADRREVPALAVRIEWG